MASLDSSKWGHVTLGISEQTNFYIIVLSQFVICFAILITLQPPFVTVSNNDDISKPQISLILILIVCLACVFTSSVMNNNLHKLWNTFR